MASTSTLKGLWRRRKILRRGRRNHAEGIAPRCWIRAHRFHLGIEGTEFVASGGEKLRSPFLCANIRVQCVENLLGHNEWHWEQYESGEQLTGRERPRCTKKPGWKTRQSDQACHPGFFKWFTSSSYLSFFSLPRVSPPIWFAGCCTLFHARGTSFFGFARL